MKAHGVDEAKMYFTPFRPSGATCATAPAQVATGIHVRKPRGPSLNRQRYDRYGNACKERTHAEKH